MGTGEDAGNFEATVRRAFVRLTSEDLPRAAQDRGWPVRTPGEFKRLLLDHLHDVPRPRAPEGANPCVFDMVLAVELGERLLAGKICCHRMNNHRHCGDDGLEGLRRLLASPRREDEF